MKQFATILMAVFFASNLANAMTRIETSSTKNEGAKVTVTPSQSGKVDTIFAGAGKMVIGGVTYAYNPLNTVVTINGKRATISDVRTGDTAKFQVVPQGAHQAALLSSLSVERR